MVLQVTLCRNREMLFTTLQSLFSAFSPRVFTLEQCCLCLASHAGGKRPGSQSIPVASRLVQCHTSTDTCSSGSSVFAGTGQQQSSCTLGDGPFWSLSGTSFSQLWTRNKLRMF